MLELIDRQEVLEIAMSYCPDDDGCCSKAGHDIREMLDEIEALPKIEAEPVRHGRWIQQGSPKGNHFNCSECGHEVCVPCSEMIDPRDYDCYLDNYCGGCGARMDVTDTNVDDKGGANNDT